MLEYSIHLCMYFYLLHSLFEGRSPSPKANKTASEVMRKPK